MGSDDFFNFAAPGTTGGAQQTIPGQPSLWDRLLGGIGALGDLGSQPKPASGPTTMPSGAASMAPSQPPPMLPQTQMPPPRGIPNLSALLNPTAAAGGAGNQGLMAQYMALQQLMRGA